MEFLFLSQFLSQKWLFFMESSLCGARFVQSPKVPKVVKVPKKFKDPRKSRGSESCELISKHYQSNRKPQRRYDKRTHSSSPSTSGSCAYFASIVAGSAPESPEVLGVTTYSCLSAYPKLFLPRKMPDTGLILPFCI